MLCLLTPLIICKHFSLLLWVVLFFIFFARKSEIIKHEWQLWETKGGILRSFFMFKNELILFLFLRWIFFFFWNFFLCFFRWIFFYDDFLRWKDKKKQNRIEIFFFHPIDKFLLLLIYKKKTTTILLQNFLFHKSIVFVSFVWKIFLLFGILSFKAMNILEKKASQRLITHVVCPSKA